MSNTQILPVNTIDGNSYNAKYAEGVVSSVIDHLIDDENKLIKTQGNTMAYLGNISMNAARKQAKYTLGLGYAEGALSMLQAGGNIYEITQTSSMLKGMKDLDTEYDPQISACEENIREVDTRLSPANDLHGREDDAADFDNNLESARLSDEDRQTYIRDRDSYLRQKGDLTDQKNQKIKDLKNAKDVSKNLGQTIGGIGNSAATIARSHKESIATIQTAMKDMATAVNSTVEKAKEAEASAIQGLTSVNMYTSFEALGRA